MKKICVYALLLTLGLCLAGQAGAVVYNFEGVWNNLSGSGLFFEELSPTAHFSGWIDYTWPGDGQEIVDEGGTTYLPPEFAYYIQISDTLSASNPSLVIAKYLDDHTFTIYDMISSLAPPSPLFLDDLYINLYSTDPLHQPLPIDLSSIIGGQVSLGFPEYGSGYWGEMEGTITSFSAAPVPEPSTILLVGLGLCAIMIGVRRSIAKS